MKFNRNAAPIQNVEEVIGVLTESDKNDWCKAVARIAWNDEPTTLNIRNMNLSQMKAFKGVKLTDEETDKLVDILLDNDYGSLESIEKALNKKKSRFTVSSTPPDTDGEEIVFDFDKGEE